MNDECSDLSTNSTDGKAESMNEDCLLCVSGRFSYYRHCLSFPPEGLSMAILLDPNIFLSESCLA